MRNSQLTAAKQASKGRSSGLHQSIEEELKEQVADVPFEVLQQVQSSGQLPSFSHRKHLVDTKRANKNRPMEVTSKKPVGRLREVIQAPKKDIRDPRFESLCGNFEEARFKKAYSFLYDEELPSERQRLQKVVKKGNAGEEVEEAEHKLAWIDRQLREEEQRRKQAEQVTQFRAKEKDAVKQGKKHYYPKKSEKRKEELVRKYQELKATGKLEKFLEKRRRKNAAKDHRYLPYRRPESNQD
jgi:ribosomal RNA-processing protein 36